MRKKSRRVHITTALAVVFATSVFHHAAAEVRVDIDKSTLNRVLAAVATTELRVPLSAERSLTVELRDLSVTGLEPTPDGAGFIRTSMRVVSRDLGLNVRVEPRITLDLVREGEGTVLEMRFDEVPIQVPLFGRLDIARFVPPMRYPTDNVWLLAGAAGDVPIVSRLSQIRMEREALRFAFDVEVPAKP